MDDQARPVARLVIDLAQIQSNYRTLQTLAPRAEVGAVVKANAYGLGATEVVPALADAGCRTFYVAQTPEGEEARRALGDREADIFVFNGFWPSELEALRRSRLFPVLNDLDQIAALKQAAPDLPCALHVDTGMNRLGLEMRYIRSLSDSPWLARGLDIRQIMSHLACADTPGHPMNARQRKEFEHLVYSELPGPRASLANSAGALLGPHFHFDVLRPGLALYGGAPAPGHKNPFVPAVRVEAPILQIRTIGAGVSIGYGAAYVAEKTTRIATVAAGYADGLLWASAKGGAAYMGETRLPILGRVSMDLIAIDLGPLADDVKPGMTVSFLGRELDAIAKAAGTISYEYLVRLGMRFDRVYQR